MSPSEPKAGQEMRSLRFSVVIPLFNKRDFIGQTLRSALAQDHDSFEIVVVDDGSTDGSLDLVAATADPRLRLVMQDNAGPGPARNRGIAQARGQWIAFLDADDVWLPDHLSTLDALIRAYPEANAVAGTFRRGAPDAFAHELRPDEAPCYMLDYFRETCRREAICSSNVAIRKAALDKLEGFGAFWPGEDIEFWSRLALDNAIAMSDRTTVIYRMETGGLMDRWEARTDPPFELQPVFSTLAEALTAQRYAEKHADIRSYRRVLLERSARQALYNGQARNARICLDLLRAWDEPPSAALRLLSYLPKPLLRRASRLYSWGKRALA